MRPLYLGVGDEKITSETVVMEFDSLCFIYFALKIYYFFPFNVICSSLSLRFFQAESFVKRSGDLLYALTDAWFLLMCFCCLLFSSIAVQGEIEVG